jgi:ABC-type Co2+ transport system permease subunit
VSAARIRRTAVAALLLLVAIAIALPAVPGTPGTLRAGGVNLLWWYGAVAAPVLATLISLGALLIRSE